jgi:hypothetical protein
MYSLPPKKNVILTLEGVNPSQLWPIIYKETLIYFFLKHAGELHITHLQHT